MCQLMRHRGSFVLLALLAALAPSGAARADMFSPSFIADDGETAVCQILNRSQKERSVEIQIRYNNGNVGATSGTQLLLPAEVRLISLAGTNGSRLHCAFLGKVSLKTARAAGEVTVGGQTKLVVPAQ